MPRFRDLPIRTKLMTGFMLTSLVALFLTVAMLAMHDGSTVRSEMLRAVDTLAGVIGENAARVIAFHDRQTARSTLAGLEPPAHIVIGSLYDSGGQLFAGF